MSTAPGQAGVFEVESALQAGANARRISGQDGAEAVAPHAGDTAPEAQSGVPEPLSRKALWAVALLALTTTFVFADQNLMAPNLSAIAKDFGMTDEERDRKLGGDVAIAFFLLGAPCSLLVGALTDAFNRRNLFVAVVLLGEGPCLATAFIQSYRQLFAMRALTGISVGGTVPLLYSLLGDLVPPSRRASVSAGVGIAQGAGIAIGQVTAGYLGAHYGWRRPFVAVACPAIVCALLTLIMVEEPRRGQQEPGLKAAGTQAAGATASDEYLERIDWPKVRGIFRIRTNLLAFAQGVPGCIPWGVINTFLADFMAQDLQMGVAAATSMVAIFGAGSVVGNFAGGFGGQALYNIRARWLAVLMGVTTSLGAIPMLVLINQRRMTMAASMWAFLAGALSCVTGTNVRAVLIGVNAPETRGTCFALFGLADSLGKGLGPAAVASLISRYGRRSAFNQAMCLWFVCGALLLAMVWTLEHDERMLQESLAALAARRASGLQSPQPQQGGGGADADDVPLLQAATGRNDATEHT